MIAQSVSVSTSSSLRVPAPVVAAEAPAEIQMAETKPIKHGRRSGTRAAVPAPVEAAKASQHKSKRGSTEAPTASQSPQPPPDAVRMQQASDAVLTRPFMLRQPDSSAPVELSAGARAVAEARYEADASAASESGARSSLSARVRDGLLELGLDQLPDMQALHVPVRVELASKAEAMQPEAHADIHLIAPEEEEETEG